MLIDGVSVSDRFNVVVPNHGALPAPEPASVLKSTRPVTGVTNQPLSPTVLAALLGQELSFYGSSYPT
jgi:hypothetical protein